MQIQTTRFGTIQVDQGDILMMPQGLIGFESCRHWVLLSNPGNEEIAWLQALGLPNVAIPVVSPRLHAPEYRVHVAQRDLAVLRYHQDDRIYVLNVVSKNGVTLTTNLKSPILLNATRKIASQIVCTDDAPLAWPIGLLPSAKSEVESAAQQNSNIVRVKAA